MSDKKDAVQKEMSRVLVTFNPKKPDEMYHAFDILTFKLVEELPWPTPDRTMEIINAIEQAKEEMRQRIAKGEFDDERK